MSEPNGDCDFIRRVAQLNLENVFGSISRLLDENSATFRWVLASLITINGGAVVALISSDHIEVAGKIIAGRFFCAGIFFAFFLAYMVMLSIKATVDPLMKLADFWLEKFKIGETNDRDAQNLFKLQGNVRSSVKPYSILSHIAGWLSVICCLLGAFMVGPYLS